MRLFKTKPFADFADKKGIEDSLLIEAVERAEKGLIDADLGGGVIKQRIARKGQGRSSGYRSLIFYKIGQHVFFVSIFEKSDKDNISRNELTALKDLSEEYFSLSDEHIAQRMKKGSLIEIFLTHIGESNEI
ncbi:type II toxin-antitoxin system RelE/ParE family toxin [Lonepinella sp. BR2474]|uniref:type II toxin-antitoxin system RelE/ParE family toxin n=1 Tax=Lonepinella sp. BR2474 TaxID=3434548 RepID=UPI003F6DC171